MKNMKKIVSLLGVTIAIGFSACKDIDTFVMEDHQGAFILNKGTDKSSISYYSYERETVSNNYFDTKNSAIGMNAGAHTMVIRKGSKFPKGKAFIVYPQSDEIAMVNLEEFEFAGTIEYYKTPTDILLTKEDEAYICATGEKGKGMVYKYDLKKKEEVEAIEVAKEPLKMITAGKHLYCASKGDGTGAKVIVIDMTKAAKVDTIALPFENPVDMVVDIDRNVWVYCAGDESALVKLKREIITEEIGPDDNRRDTTYVTNVSKGFLLGDKLNDSPNPLTISKDGRSLYYVYGSLCKNSVYAEETLSKEAIITGDYKNETFASIDYDARTNRIMALTATGKLVILMSQGDVWNNKEVYEIGANPLIAVFNY